MIKYNKGQISISVAIVSGVFMLGSSIAAAWGTANSKVSDIKETVAIVKTTEELHYKELREKLDGIDKKLDKIIEKR